MKKIAVKGCLLDTISWSFFTAAAATAAADDESNDDSDGDDDVSCTMSRIMEFVDDV